jgi:hypothetical protein
MFSTELHEKFFNIKRLAQKELFDKYFYLKLVVLKKIK